MSDAAAEPPRGARAIGPRRRRLYLLLGIFATILALGGIDVSRRPAPAAPVVRTWVFAGREPPLGISFLGTSLTAGETWPASVALRVAACSGRAVRATALGQPGGDSEWGSRFAVRSVSGSSDVLIVELATNDADLRHSMSIRASSANMTALFDTAQRRSPGLALYLLQMPNPQGPRAWIRPQIDAYQAAHEAVAVRHAATVLDFRGPDAAAGKFAADGLHPSPRWFDRTVVPSVARSICASLTSRPSRR